MTPLAVTALALYAAAAVAAVATCRKKAASSPAQDSCRLVVAYLIAVVLLDGLRWLRALLLEPATGPRVGWDLVLRHAEVGLYLGSILALPAMAVALFSEPGRHGDRWVTPVVLGSVWLHTWIWIASSYPDLRGAALLRVYDLVEAGAVVVSLGCAGVWLRRLIRGEAECSPAHLAGLALIAGPTASCCVSWLSRATVLDGWPYIVAGNAVAVAAALVLLLHGLLRARRRSTWA